MKALWKSCEAKEVEDQSKINWVWTLRPGQVGSLPDACGILRNSESGVDIWSVWRSKCKMPLLDNFCVMENARLSGRTGLSQLVTSQANNRPNHRKEGICGISLTVIPGNFLRSQRCYNKIIIAGVFENLEFKQRAMCACRTSLGQSHQQLPAQNAFASQRLEAPKYSEETKTIVRRILRRHAQTYWTKRKLYIYIYW